MPQPFRDAAFHAAIEAAVARAEARTAAEFVVVLADRSGDYGDVDHRAGGILAFLLLAFMVYAPFSVPEPVALLNVVVAYGAGFLLSRHTPALRRLLTSAARRREQVAQGARLAFAEEAVHATRARTGVLLYLSETERRGVLVPDVGIRGKVEGAALTPVERALGAWTDPRPATLESLDALADLLAGAFPAGPDDTDEIANRPRFRR